MRFPFSSYFTKKLFLALVPPVDVIVFPSKEAIPAKRPLTMTLLLLSVVKVKLNMIPLVGALLLAPASFCQSRFKF